eukprot:602287_1
MTSFLYYMCLIPWKAMKEALLAAINGLNTETTNDLQYKCLPITNILPDDLIQHIVSFSDSLAMKYINKAFNGSYNKNKTLELRQRQQVIDKHAFNPSVKYGEKNQTWIIHPTRTHLNSEEIAHGYNGPLKDLKGVKDAVKPGDKLLFYDGYYIETKAIELDNFRNNLQFIGVGNEVVIKVYGCSQLIEIGNYGNCQSIYFKNVKIEMGDPFCIQYNSEIYMEDCEIVMGSSSIDVSYNGRFNAKNCVFSGQSDAYKVSPISIEYRCGSK